MSAVTPRKKIDDDGSGSDEKCNETVGSKGWSLRLLLSLEESERTRTRLLVREVIAGVVAEIIDVIPTKVRTRDRDLPLLDVLEVVPRFSFAVKFRQQDKILRC